MSIPNVNGSIATISVGYGPGVGHALSAGIAGGVGVVHGGGGGVGGFNYAAVNTPNIRQGPMHITGELKLTGDNADVIISTKSMKGWMEAVERRLLILEPKKELIDEFEALREAYNHYKTLEALLYDEKK